MSRIINDKYLILLLLIPLIFIVYPLLREGIVLFGDFPIGETSLYSNKFLTTWIEHGSYPAFETLSRYPIISLGYFLESISIGPDILSKSLVVVGFFTASLSFYFSSLMLFKRVNEHVTLYKIAAIIGSLFYAYNVWSFHRIHHWYLWLGYAMLPLFIILLIYSFKNPTKWKYIFATVGIWSLASSTPHMTIFYGLFYLGLSIFFIVSNIRNRGVLIKLARPILLIIFLYFLINMYWIYPYGLYGLNSNEAFTPSVLITEEQTENLSRDSNFLNVLRLIQDWWQPRIINVSPPETSLLYPFWLFVSFAFPILAFSSLLLKKNSKLVLVFSIAAIVGIVLALGTNAPFNLYSTFLFEAPLFSILPFVFRDPDKWSFLIALALSFLLSMTTFELLKRIKKSRYKNVYISCFLLFILGCFVLYAYPTYSSTAETLFDPVILPPEIDNLNNYLMTVNTEKVFFISRDIISANWSEGKEVYLLHKQSSDKPNMVQYLPTSRNYHNFLIDTILLNKSSNINNFIFPLGTKYLIYNDDKINAYYTKLLNELFLLQDFKNIKDIGSFKIFRVGNSSNDVGEVRLTGQSIVLAGGLDLLTSLNALPHFSSLNSSLLFLDQDFNKWKYKAINSADILALTNTVGLSLFSLDERYTVKPIDFTDHFAPSDEWSKAGGLDPSHGEYHSILKEKGLQNWDFDYGKGLVITDAKGVNLSIPVDIEVQNENTDSKDNTFHLFIRFLKNQQGGSVKVYLDGKLIDELDTYNKIMNKFVWERIGSLNMTEGKHTLTLENVAGFNAVNIFAFIPPDEMNRISTETAHLLADNKQIIYLLEAESNFYNNKGTDSDSFYPLFNDSNIPIDSNVQNHIFAKTVKGQFKVPTNSDLVSLQFLAKQNPYANSSYSIKDIEITPVYEYDVITSDFEREDLSQLDWINYQKDILSTSLESSEAISGNKSLKADVKQGNFSYWGTISSDFVPTNENAYYNVSFDVSAQDVIQLHSKVLYFDANKTKINEDFVFGGTDGSFEQRIKKSLSPSIGTKYIQLQMLVSPNLEMNSSYLLDNVELKKILPVSAGISFKDNLASFENLDSNEQRIIVSNDAIAYDNINNNKFNSSLNVELEKGNSTKYYKIVTKPTHIIENHPYNYTMTVGAENITALSAIASFKNSSDVVVDSTKFGNNASNGEVLSLSAGSEIYTKFDILKPSNYVVALRVKTCETCNSLRMSLLGEDNKTNVISLKDTGSQLKWLYTNSTYLQKGTYELKIYSDNRTDLDSVILYSGNGNASYSTNMKHELEDLFRDVLPSAHIEEYEKTNPTKHIVMINNATKPYMLSFAEAYDPLWIAKIEDINGNKFETGSIPLYSIINGFYINKTGNYTLTIEYQPQKWFTEAGTVSLITLIAILIIYFIGIKNIYARKWKSRI